MSCKTTITVTPPPAGICFPPKWFAWLKTALKIALENCGLGDKIIKSITAPLVDESGVIWRRIDENGCDLGLFVKSNGVWRRMPGASLPIGLKGFYTGPIVGVFDPITFQGIKGGEWDGWTLRLTAADKFIALASSYNAGLGQWESAIAGGAPANSGGAPTHTLTLGETPSPAIPEVKVSLKGASNVVNPGDGRLYGPVEASSVVTLFAGSAGSAGGPHSIMNPYVSMALVEYTGICI